MTPERGGWRAKREGSSLSVGSVRLGRECIDDEKYTGYAVLSLYVAMRAEGRLICGYEG